MIRHGDLRGRRLRRHRRILRRVAQRGVIYVRSEHEFRMVERLHAAGMVTACISKLDWVGSGTRPFREFAVFALDAGAEALRRRLYGDRAMVRHRSRVAGRGRS